MKLMRASAVTLILILTVLAGLQNSNAGDRGAVLYDEAFQYYKSLASDPDKVQNKEIWETIAKTFFSIYIDYSDSEKAPDALFVSSKMYEEMGERFNSQYDLDKSVEYSRILVRKYPDISLADDAQLRVARIVEKHSKSDAYPEYEKVVKKFPDGDMKPIAQKKMDELAAYKPNKRVSTATTSRKPAKIAEQTDSKLINVSQIRHWSTDSFTRVVIHVDKEVTFRPIFLKADPSIGKPPRLFVDIDGTRVNKNLYLEPIHSGLLEDIKFARNTRDKVRVVLYIRSFEDYKVFALQDPFRIVMDIYGDGSGQPGLYAKDRDANQYEYGSSLPEDKVSSLSEALGLKIRTVVLDPGHGGHDPGAIGPSGLKEKDINLKIAKALKSKLERDGRQFGITNVYITRETDKFIPLEERTGIAKKLGADLFISIHCNAARNRSATGIETYFLSLTNDQRSLAVAARENATTSISRSEMKKILNQYVLSAKLEESERLAGLVQNSLYKSASRMNKSTRNKGVKKAPFVVLIGADVPSILVETSFITNPNDEKLMKKQEYIDSIADGMFAGIKTFSGELQTASVH